MPAMLVSVAFGAGCARTVVASATPITVVITALDVTTINTSDDCRRDTEAQRTRHLKRMTTRSAKKNDFLCVSVPLWRSPPSLLFEVSRRGDAGGAGRLRA